MKLKHVLTGSVMGLSLVTAGVITTSVLPTSSVEAAEYRKIYADVTAQFIFSKWEPLPRWNLSSFI